MHVAARRLTTIMIRVGYSLMNEKPFHDFPSFQKYIKRNPNDSWLQIAAYMLQFLSSNNLSDIHFVHYDKFGLFDAKNSNDSLLGSLESGNIATTLLNLAITEERRKHFDFSTPHRSNEYCFFMRKRQIFAESSWTDACPIPVQYCALMAVMWIALEALHYYFLHSSSSRISSSRAEKWIFLLKIFCEATSLQFYLAGLKANTINMETEYLFETVTELTKLLIKGNLYMVAYDKSVVEFDLLNNTKLVEYLEFRDAFFSLQSTRILPSFADVCQLLNVDEKVVYFSTLNSLISLCGQYLENLQYICPQNRFILLEAFGFTKGSPLLEKINFAAPFIVAEDIRVVQYGLRGLYDEGSSRTSLATWLPSLNGSVGAASLESVALAVIALICGFLISSIIFCMEYFEIGISLWKTCKCGIKLGH